MIKGELKHAAPREGSGRGILSEACFFCLLLSYVVTLFEDMGQIETRDLISKLNPLLIELLLHRQLIESFVLYGLLSGLKPPAALTTLCNGL